MISSFQTELKEIKEKVTALGNGLLQGNTLLLDALSDCEPEKFNGARAHLKNVISKTDDIDNLIIKILALYTPEARDLREVIAYMKIASELARASSSTRSFIRGFTDVCSEVDVQMIKEYAVPMQSSTVQAIKLSLEMLNCDDDDEIKELYNDVLIEESKTDDLYEIVERKLSDQAQGIDTFEKFHKILRALRKSEKVASRTTSIANLLVYAQVGGNYSR